MTIYIGADHRGFKLKEKIKPWLMSLGYQVIDCGNRVLDPSDDYTDFSFAVADQVVDSRDCAGIVICGSGVGVTIAVNKVRGARCSTAISVSEVERARADDDLNILAISADYTSPVKVKKMIEVFLRTPFNGDERHTRRLEKIAAREREGS